jgi:hypothetical protein
MYRDGKRICRHCQSHKANRPRGLCWSCYYTPGVKELYPTSSKYGRRSDDTNHGHAQSKPATDTARVEPGSPEKVALMAGRVLRGESLTDPSEPNYVQERQHDFTRIHTFHWPGGG